MKTAFSRRMVCLVLLAALSSSSRAAQAPDATIAVSPKSPEPQNMITIDATAPVAQPQPVKAQLGTARNPKGDEIGVNSQFLTFNQKPWIPVMGEFHFSRYPEQQWEREILKMKAAGVQIISTYIIWIHHEQVQGTFDWKGQRDLRHFTELCAKHGMYVYPRIGPWAHAEVRNGGLPDWVVKAGPTRQDDPKYLASVQTFYQQIALQLHGLLWKDGGPVIGIQIENEYRDRGPGKGDDHIRTLKKMAIADGFDVPLYTVTGWDGAAIPLDAVLPVFGGYPDAPWDGSPKRLPPNEIYAFRFNNRSAGSMGAIGGRGQSAASTYAGTPFLTAEIGDGTEDTYFRRPVISTDDVAAIPGVMLGSGANLLGYYMFHGGRNPDVEPGTNITLQESQVTGYPTDLPERSYDFQAPLGEYGQERESLRKLKLVHYFLEDFGSILAPMTPRTPARVPADPSDASVPRVSARTNGDAGFIFFSNYVRSLDMPGRPGFQVALHLPGGTVHVPETPVSLPAGAYGIWPVDLKLPQATLRYSTAQLFKRVEAQGQTWIFFAAIPGMQPEFAFDSSTKLEPLPPGATIKVAGPVKRILLNENAVADIRVQGNTHLVLLPQTMAEAVWRTDDPHTLIMTGSMAIADAGEILLDSVDAPDFDFALFGSSAAPIADGTRIVASAATPEIFHHYSATLPAVSLQAVVRQLKPAGMPPAAKLGESFSWRPTPIPIAPQDFTAAGQWSISVPAIPAGSHLSDAFLTIDYQGDVGRLTQTKASAPGVGAPLDDNFWNGQLWTVGLRELEAKWPAAAQFDLSILPLSGSSGLYLEAEPAVNSQGFADGVRSVRVLPQYELVLHLSGALASK